MSHCNNGLNNHLVNNLIETKVAKETGDLKYLQDSMREFIAALSDLITGKYSDHFLEEYVGNLFTDYQSTLEESFRIPQLKEEVTLALQRLSAQDKTVKQHTTQLSQLFGDISKLGQLPPFEEGVLADTFVTVTASGADQVARNQRDKNSDVVSVKDFGAVGDGVTNDTNSIQAAINSGKAIWLPDGNYLVDSLLIDKDYFEMYGTKKAILVANSSVKVLEFKKPTGAVQRILLRGFRINGDNKATHGIYSEAIAHTTIDKVMVYKIAGTAITTGEGWCIDITNCELSYSENGYVTTGGNNNAINFTGNKVFSMSKIGIGLSNGIKANITGNTIERCDEVGVVASAFRGLELSNNYFEQNGVNGYSIPPLTDITLPKTIYSDVVLNGSARWDIGNYAFAYPVRQGNINNNTFSAAANNTTHITLFAGININIKHNATANAGNGASETYASFIDFYETHGAANQTSINIESNAVRSDVPLYRFKDVKSSGITGRDISTINIDTVETNNYAPQKYSEWEFIPGTGGYIARSEKNLDGFETSKIVGGGVAVYRIDLDGEHKNLAGKTVYFSVKCEIEDPADTRFYLGVTGFVETSTAYTASKSGLDNRILVVKLPESGSHAFKVTMTYRGSATGVAHFALPIIQEVGVDRILVASKTPKQIKEWLLPEPPTKGYWSTGDLVYNSEPVSGSHVGWVCVSGGDPTVWQPFGKIDTSTAVLPPATSGTTEQRPEDVQVGYIYFDTTLGKPIYFKSTGVWVDSTGAAV